MALLPVPRLSLSRIARTLYGGAATFLAIYVLGSAISFLVHGLLARTIGAGSYGHFAYATHWMAVLLLLCNLGLKSTLTGFVSAYRAKEQWALLRGLLRRATQWTTAASVTATTPLESTTRGRQLAGMPNWPSSQGSQLPLSRL